MTDFQLTNPAFIVSQYIPMGKNSMISFNRHIGAHKKYKAPTEFGLRGSVQKISKGSFQMEKEGVLLSVEDFGFSTFSKVLLRSFDMPDKMFGMKLDQDGFSYLGIKLPNNEISADESIATTKLNSSTAMSQKILLLVFLLFGLALSSLIYKKIR